MISKKYILLILNCYKYKDKAIKQKKLWLDKLNNPDMVYYHIIGDAKLCNENQYILDQSNNMIYTNTMDDYLSLPHKIITAIDCINATHNYEYIFKTDDDQNLVDCNFFTNTITLINHHKYNYGGYSINVNDHYSNYYTVHSELPKVLLLKKTIYCSGRFYILSKAAVLNLLSKKDLIKTHIIEDHAIGYYIDNNLKNNILHLNTNKYFIDII